jgi:hypothetical protein
MAFFDRECTIIQGQLEQRRTGHGLTDEFRSLYFNDCLLGVITMEPVNRFGQTVWLNGQVHIIFNSIFCFKLKTLVFQILT